MQNSTSLTMVKTNTHEGITHLAQEAVALAHRLGFGRRFTRKAVTELTSNTTQAHNLLNNGALFCWECDPD